MTLRNQSIRCSSLTVIAVLAAVFVGCGLVPANARAAPREKKPDAKHQVEALEEQWRVAQLAGDTGTMEKMLSDDYLGILMNGEVETKAQELELVAKRRLMLTKIELSDRKVKLIGPIAIVTSRAEVEGTNDGQPVKGMFRYTRIYRHLASGQWKITSFEATREHRSRRQMNAQDGTAATGDAQPDSGVK